VFELGYPTEIELQMLQRLADGVTVTDLQPCITLADVQELHGCALKSKWKTLTAVHPQLGSSHAGMKKLPLASVLVVP